MKSRIERWRIGVVIKCLSGIRHEEVSAYTGFFGLAENLVSRRKSSLLIY
jgi:hypothetical protein